MMQSRMYNAQRFIGLPISTVNFHYHVKNLSIQDKTACNMVCLVGKQLKLSYLPISPLRFPIFLCYQWYKHFTTTDSKVERILPINTSLNFMYVLKWWSVQCSLPSNTILAIVSTIRTTLFKI
jgi:hypothetical protein